jgi:hypothetical protein
MARLPAVFEPLDSAADAVIAAASQPGIEVRRDILDTLDDGLGFLGNAIGVMGWELEDARYGPEILEPAHRAVAAIHLAARICREARGALDGLLNTSIGGLASSGRQVPKSTELNGGH